MEASRGETRNYRTPCCQNVTRDFSSRGDGLEKKRSYKAGASMRRATGNRLARRL